MLPNRMDRKNLAQEYASDINRMRDCIRTINKREFTDDELVSAWSKYSDSLCAMWLGLPDKTSDLLNVLKKYIRPIANTVPISWQATILNAGGSSGDGIIELPDDLLAQMGWELGDELNVSCNEHDQILVQRKD